MGWNPGRPELGPNLPGGGRLSLTGNPGTLSGMSVCSYTLGGRTDGRNPTGKGTVACPRLPLPWCRRKGSGQSPQATFSLLMTGRQCRSGAPGRPVTCARKRPWCRRKGSGQSPQATLSLLMTGHQCRSSAPGRPVTCARKRPWSRTGGREIGMAIRNRCRGGRHDRPALDRRGDRR